MEHSFKRRKLSPRSGGSPRAFHSHKDEMGSSDNDKIEPARRSLRSRSYGNPLIRKLIADHLPHSPRGSEFKNSKLSALHPRNFVPTQAADSVQRPAKTVIASVVQVVVNDGNGAEVTELLVPVKTSVISLEGFAPITLADKSAPTPSPIPPDYLNPSLTRSDASSSKAAQTIQVQASRTPSNAASSADVLGGTQSQVVLSSPPSTPLPSSPSSSPSSSYFSSSIESASGGAQSSLASQTAKPSPGSNNGNLTASASSSPFASSNSFNPAITIISENSTLITSTRSSASQTSGIFLTPSGSSAQTTSSGALSSSDTASASQTQSSSSGAASSSLAPSNTGVAGGGVGGSGSPSGSSTPSSTAGAATGSGNGGSPSTPAVVGGVVGGLAGLAIILLLLLFLLRRRRAAQNRQRNISPPIPQTQTQISSTGATTERSSMVPFAAGAFLRRMRPGSGQTIATTSTAPSERGFQNMGGRKLESVLSSRGDGYSDPVPTSGVPPRNYGGTAAGLGLAAGVAQPGPFRGTEQGLSPGPSDAETLSGSSFYRDSHGFYGGNEGGAASMTSPSTSPTGGGLSPAPAGPSEIAITRPGPARTPVINQPGFAPVRQSPGTGRGTPPPGTGRGTPPSRARTPQLRQQDALGRSHPSFDGSRGSRFAEDI